MTIEQSPDESGSSAMRESIRFWVLLVVFIVVLCVLAALPALLAAWLSPWIGAVVGVALLWAWVKLVPSGPGLAQGCLCITGAASILASLVHCLVLTVRQLLA